MIWALLMIAVAILLVVILISMMYFYRNRKLPPTDYYSFFVMGICWLPIGIIGLATRNSGFYGFFVLGLVFTVVGLVNKDKWKRNHRSWHQLPKEEQRMKMVVMLGLGVLLVIGLVAFFFARYLA